MVGDIVDFELSDEMFDKILLSQVIERIREDEKALEELYRVLNPDGCLVLDYLLKGKWSSFKNKKQGKKQGNKKDEKK